MNRQLLVVTGSDPYRGLNPYSMARELEDAVNGHRRRLGLRALRPNRVLAAAARQHSERMRNLDFFNHEDLLDCSSVSERVATIEARRWALLAENLAAGQWTPEQIVEGWLDSPGHRANLEDPRVSEIGTSVALGGQLRTSITQLYGCEGMRLEPHHLEPEQLAAQWSHLRRSLDSAIERCIPR